MTFAVLQTTSALRKRLEGGPQGTGPVGRQAAGLVQVPQAEGSTKGDVILYTATTP